MLQDDEIENAAKLPVKKTVKMRADGDPMYEYSYLTIRCCFHLNTCTLYVDRC